MSALLGTLLALCLGVFLVGKFVQRRVAKTSPESMALDKLTPLGLVWNACFVTYLVMIPATYYLMPDTWAAAFLSNWYGVPIALVLGLLLFAAGGTTLELIGFRMRWRPGRR